MPLKRGKSRATVSGNIRELESSLEKHGGKDGKPQSRGVALKRAIAGALRLAKESK